VSRFFIIALVAAAVSLGATGCGGSDEPTGPAPIKATADGAKSGVWLGLEPRIEDGKLVVEVVAHDVPELSGVAVRIEHPEWAKFEGRDVAPGWDAEALHLVKEVGAKEVSIVDTAKGDKSGRAGGARVLVATLRFKLDGAPTATDLGTLRIVPIRSELRDGKGKMVSAQFSGAKLSR